MNPTINDQINILRTAGREAEILPLLAKYVTANPQDAQGWYEISKYVEQKERKLDCLERALRIDPAMVDAQLAKKLLTVPVDAPTSQEFSEAVKLAETTDVPVDSLIFADKPARVSSAIPQQPMETSIPKTAPVKPTVSHPPASAKPTMPPSPKPQTVKIKSNRAGESTSRMAKYWAGVSSIQRTFMFIFFGAILICVPLMIFFPDSSIRLFCFALVIGLIVDLISTKEKKSWKKSKDFKKGAQGEVKIDEILSELGEDYAIWNDVAGDFGNFDHIVLSKQGKVFMIETKSHGGKVTFDGNDLLVNGHEPEKDFIQQCSRNSASLSETLSRITGNKVWVTAILVFSAAFVERHYPINYVYVTYGKGLCSTIHYAEKKAKSNPALWGKFEKLNELFGEPNLSYSEFGLESFHKASDLKRFLD